MGTERRASIKRWGKRWGLGALALVALACAVVACSPVRALNALAPSDTYRLTPSVAYGDDPRQRLDVYRPAQASPPAGYPVVLFFYGGSWNSGERADYRFVGEALAERGVLTLIADYRLYPTVSYPDFLKDCTQALAWTLDESARFGGDSRRVFVAGHSAGAYNAAMLALDKRWLAATGHSPKQLAGWIGLAGPYDFLPIGNPDVKPVFHYPDYPAGSQPIDHADAASPPAFLAVGDSDSFVDPQRNTMQMAAKLKAAGVPVTLERYTRVNHMTLAGAFGRPLRWLAPVQDDVVRFIMTVPARTS